MKKKKSLLLFLLLFLASCGSKEFQTNEIKSIFSGKKYTLLTEIKENEKNYEIYGVQSLQEAAYLKCDTSYQTIVPRWTFVFNREYDYVMDKKMANDDLEVFMQNRVLYQEKYANQSDLSLFFPFCNQREKVEVTLDNIYYLDQEAMSLLLVEMYLPFQIRIYFSKEKKREQYYLAIPIYTFYLREWKQKELVDNYKEKEIISIKDFYVDGKFKL